MRDQSTGGKHKAHRPNPALHLVSSSPAPCFYPVALPSSAQLLRSSYIYTVLKLHSAFEGNLEADVAPSENEMDTPGLEKSYPLIITYLEILPLIISTKKGLHEKSKPQAFPWKGLEPKFSLPTWYKNPKAEDLTVCKLQRRSLWWKTVSALHWAKGRLSFTEKISVQLPNWDTCNRITIKNQHTINNTPWITF